MKIVNKGHADHKALLRYILFSTSSLYKDYRWCHFCGSSDFRTVSHNMLHGVAVSGALFAAYWTLIKQTKRVVVSISVVILYANNTQNSAGTGDGWL